MAGHALKPMSQKPSFDIILATDVTELFMIIKAHIGPDVAKMFADLQVEGEEFCTFKEDNFKSMLGKYGTFLTVKRCTRLATPDDVDVETEVVEHDDGFKTPTRKRSSSQSTPASSKGKVTPKDSDGFVGHPVREEDITAHAMTTSIKFTIYRSTPLLQSKNSGKLSETARTSLVQVTVENMRSKLLDKGMHRDPSVAELQEVSRQLCEEYPVLEEIPLLNSLKRRCSNTKFRSGGVAVKKTKLDVNATGGRGRGRGRGRGPGRGSAAAGKESDLPEFPSLDESSMMHTKPGSAIVDDELGIETLGDIYDDTLLSGTEMDDFMQTNTRSERDSTEITSTADEKLDEEEEEEEDSGPTEEDTKQHYAQLRIETDKERKNWKVINHVMDLEFPGEIGRQNFCSRVKSTGYKKRVAEILERYPIFRENPNVLMLEVKRWRDSTADKDWVKTASAAMLVLMKDIVEYGTSNHKVTLENNTDEAKVKIFLTQLHKIFPNRGRKPHGPLFLETTAKNIEAEIEKSDYPRMLQEEEDGAVSFSAGGQDLGCCNRPKTMMDWAKFVIMYMGIFYTFRFGFPHGYEVALMLIQNFAFQDMPVPAEIRNTDYKKMLKKYCDFSKKD